MVKTIVLIGAGSAMFTQGLVADLILTKKNWRLCLVDIDPQALQVAQGLAQRMIRYKDAPISLLASTERSAMLRGADYVVTTIGVGGRTAWLADVQIPRRYNIYQPVGDTTMAGGISRAMRMIPALVEIANDVKRLCPQALFVNYANPMSVNCWAIRQATDVPVVGLCIGTYDVERELAHLMGYDPSECTFNSAGINHFTWVYGFKYRGEDAWPAVRRHIAAHPPEHNRFSWSLFEAYGAYPAVNDRHVTEFFPQRFPNGYYYGNTLGVSAFSLEQTIEYGQRIYEHMGALARGDEPINERLFERAEGEHGQLTEMIDSIEQDAARRYAANLPNAGLIPQLAPNAILEATCRADRDGFTHLPTEGLHPALVAPLMQRIAVHDLTVQAALTGERKLLVEAMLLDGCISDPVSAERLVDDLLQAQKAFLPQFA